MYNFRDIVKMHEYLFPDMDERIRINTKDINILDNHISMFWFNLNMNTILSDTLKLCATILCMQPFHDGNSRLSKYLLTIILNYFNYNINYEDIKDSYIIPLFYEINDQIIDDDIERFNSIIKGRKN